MPLTASMRMDILLNGDDRVIKIEGNDVPVGTISTHFSTENDITTYYHLEMCDDIHYDIRDAMPSEEKPATHFPYKEAAPCVFWASIKRTVGCVSCKTPLFTGGRFPTVTMLLDGTEYTVDVIRGRERELYALVREGKKYIAGIIDKRGAPHAPDAAGDETKLLFSIYLSPNARIQQIEAAVFAQCYVELLAIKNCVRIRAGKTEDVAHLEEACKTIFH